MSTTYPSRGLPEQWFYTHGITGNEVSFKPQNQLREVLVQGNGVYLVLDLPHLVTKVIIAFPTQGVVRVYLDQLRQSNMLAQVEDVHWPRQIPKPARYRFGMRLTPFLFGAFLSPGYPDSLLLRTAVVNYPVLACESGHSGVLIRVSRIPDQYADQSLELYWFSTGNDHNFNTGWKTHPKTKLLACFRPGGEGLNEGKLWVPEQLT